MATRVCSYESLGRGPMVGDRVLISDKKRGHRWNPDGHMDEFLSTVMTVRAIRRSGHDFSLAMIEDRDAEYHIGGWFWFPEMIDGVVIDEIDDDTSSWTIDFNIRDLFE